jgi:hypothetical protein
MQEKKYTGYGYHGGGRKKQGPEAKRETVSFVCTPSEKQLLKELAQNAGLSQSQFICKKIFG